ncbi:MAG: hypothetical protein ACRCUP_07600 [Mycoplasmatales bacterium]
MFKKMKEQKLKKQIKSFLNLNGFDDFIIDEDMPPYLRNYEIYNFIEENKELNVWEYGDVNRGSRHVAIWFETFKEALFYHVYNSYVTGKTIEIRGKNVQIIRTIPFEKQLDFILKVANENYLDMEELKIKNGNELIYNNPIS